MTIIGRFMVAFGESTVGVEDDVAMPVVDTLAVGADSVPADPVLAVSADGALVDPLMNEQVRREMLQTLRDKVEVIGKDLPETNRRDLFKGLAAALYSVVVRSRMPIQAITGSAGVVISNLTKE